MYRRIVVPLDGSKIAEGVLPHAIGLAKAHQAELALVRAVDPRSAVPNGYVLPEGPAQALQRTMERDAQAYLTAVAAGLSEQGIPVVTAVVTGPPAEGVVAWATSHEADLIALMSHGLGRSARWVFGSVADRLLQSSPIPILVVRATQQVLESQEEYEESLLDTKLLEAMQPQ
ncbi:MAG: universal stress protein [Chloroflexota bacterium]